MTGSLGDAILATFLKPERRRDDTAKRGTALETLPASGDSLDPESPVHACCRVSNATGRPGCARPVDVYARIRTSRCQRRDHSFSRSAGQGRCGALLGDLVNHLPERDALRAEGTRGL